MAFFFYMIKIYTESKFLEEKKYVFHVILKEILGLDFCVYDTSVSQIYKFVLPNQKYIEFADDFFTHIPESIGYCEARYLPQKLVMSKQIANEDIPFLYGNTSYTEHEQFAYCGGDVIASAFFLLSRWEEIALTALDKWGRFDENESFIVKTDLVKKPVVHIYANIIKQLFGKYGYEIEENRTFAKVLTHDVDFVYKWSNKWDYVKTCLADVVKRHSLHLLRTTMEMRKNGRDPYDTYDYLMRMSEQNKVKSIFYFLKTRQNNVHLLSEKGKNIIQSITNRGHIIGLHTNYYKEADKGKIFSDKESLESLTQRKLVLNRQHYLRLQMPQTMELLQQCGLEQDSSLYFSHHPGFRTGMCIEHSLFNCLTHKMLKIKELPLVLMDTSLLSCKNTSEALACVDALLQEVKKYHGNFVCLWHNSSFNAREWNSLREVYDHILKA